MTNEDIKIKDDFLDQEEFNKLQQTLTGNSGFPWFYNEEIDFKDDVNKFQLIHMFQYHSAPTSESFQIVLPIVKLIQPLSILQIKANLLTRTPEIVENTFHVDIGKPKSKRIAQWTTSIFYVNTNNGYTKFEDGTKVESVANRLVSFPANMKHTGTSCTDKKTRIVINFNYFEDA